MLLLLGYILTSAINARASFNLSTHEYTYFEGINKNLPHSYDAKGTWFLFWQYLGTHYFVLVSSRLAELALGRLALQFRLNPRLKRLLFLICLNGGALALECILQRIYYGDYQGKLLFLIEPGINSGNLAQFGPFAYRSNAASYLNLIWPLGLGIIHPARAGKSGIRKTTGWQRAGADLDSLHHSGCERPLLFHPPEGVRS